MIRDTAKEAQENPALTLGKLMFGGPNAIEKMEADGQRELCESAAQLPTKCDQRGREALEAAGVKFDKSPRSDDLFMPVVLPQGWKIVPTDHSMWSKLLDAKGFERAKIFYKAAFYDRSAHMHVCCRYAFKNKYEGQGDNAKRTVRIKDATTGASVYESAPISQRDYPALDAAEKTATKHMDETLPNWRDPGAYWS